MSLGFTGLTPEGRKYFAELERLAGLEVAVGFQDDGEVYEDGAKLPDVAAWNELGTSNAPSRPFMRQSFGNHEDRLENACAHLNKSIAEGDDTQRALEELGVFLKGLVQEEIVEGDFLPNAPSTVAKKHSDTPLVDTGTMRQSVNYVIRSRTE